MMMLRMGAENLYKVTTDVRTKGNVAIELRFINSNLQLLREQLGELNSVVDVYQGKHMGRIPMIRESCWPIAEDHREEDGIDLNGRWIMCLPDAKSLKHAFFKIMKICEDFYSTAGKMKMNSSMEKLNIKILHSRLEKDKLCTQNVAIICGL